MLLLLSFLCHIVLSPFGKTWSFSFKVAIFFFLRGSQHLHRARKLGTSNIFRLWEVFWISLQPLHPGVFLCWPNLFHQCWRHERRIRLRNASWNFLFSNICKLGFLGTLFWCFCFRFYQRTTLIRMRWIWTFIHWFPGNKLAWRWWVSFWSLYWNSFFVWRTQLWI